MQCISFAVMQVQGSTKSWALGSVSQEEIITQPRAHLSVESCKVELDCGVRGFVSNELSLFKRNKHDLQS